MSTAPGFSFVDVYLLQKVLEATGHAPIQAALENGPVISTPGTTPLATVRFRDRRALARLVLNPEMRFGDGYSEGRIEVEGNLLRFLEGVYRSMVSEEVTSWSTRLDGAVQRGKEYPFQ